MPYFGYARQDRKPGPRTPISAKLVANLIERAGVDRVMTVDLHAGQIQGFFDIPTDNLFAAPVMVRDIQERYGTANLVVVSPDVGGVVRARGLAKRIDVPIAICDKRREQPGESEVMNVIGDVQGQALHPDRRHRRFRRHAGQRRRRAARAGRHRGDGLHHARRAVGRRGEPSITDSRLKSLVITDSIHADRSGEGRQEHPRPLDRAADRRSHRAHCARGKRLEPVLLRHPWFALRMPSPAGSKLLIGVVGGRLFPRRLQRLGAAMTSITLTCTLTLTCTGNPHSPRRARGWAGPTNGANRIPPLR